MRDDLHWLYCCLWYVDIKIGKTLNILQFLHVSCWSRGIDYSLGDIAGTAASYRMQKLWQQFELIVSLETSLALLAILSQYNLLRLTPCIPWMNLMFNLFIFFNCFPRYFLYSIYIRHKGGVHLLDSDQSKYSQLLCFASTLIKRPDKHFAETLADTVGNVKLCVCGRVQIIIVCQVHVLCSFQLAMYM